ncbi:MAG: DUF2860 family protein, partial [Acidiferrobacterales bacterium]
MLSPKWVWVLCVLVGFTSKIFAQQVDVGTIPKESGVSGFVNLGAGVIRAKSNLIAGNSVADIGHEIIPSIFTQADARTDGIPIINLEVAYTWGPKRTQVFFGNLLEDFLRFDTATQLGVRHQFRNKTIFAASFLFSSIPTKVWDDPYVANVPRRETNRTSNGGRLTLSRIGGSGLRLRYSQREVKLDLELSGRTQLGLPLPQAALLNRNGDYRRLDVSYVFRVGKRNILTPALWFSDFDLDGKAMAHDLAEFQITHIYSGPRFNFVTNAVIGTADFDAVHPIYGVTRDDDRVGLSFAVFDKKLFGANA